MTRVRGPRLTATRRKFIIGHLTEGASITEVMQALNLDRDVYYQWREEDPTFEHETGVARRAKPDAIEAELEKILSEGGLEVSQRKVGGGDGKEVIIQTEQTRKFYPSTMLRYLERRHPDYKDGRRIDGVSVEINLPAQGLLDITKLTAAEQREFKRLLIKCGAEIVQHH